jgi:hypothetical protein
MLYIAVAYAHGGVGVGCWCWDCPHRPLSSVVHRQYGAPLLSISAVQSSPFHPAPPGAAVGQGVGGGSQGPLPDHAPLGPIYEKSRFQDAKPTLLPNPQPYKPPGEPGAPEEPPSYRSWVLQLEVRWPTGCRLVASSFGGFDRSHLADENPTSSVQRRP